MNYRYQLFTAAADGAKQGFSLCRIVCLVALLIIFAANGVRANVEINETNFPDDNFREYISSKCDTDKDTYLSSTEIAGVTSINVEGKNIANLKGIEYFTALKYLDCSVNSLTELDVSKNTALTMLYCSNNKLTSLDVSKNTKLNWINCFYNQLTELDVSKNTALERLECHENQLTELDMSKNTALTMLLCDNNKLTSLDVSGCTAMKSLYCEYNQLTSLDLSENTALTYLSCYNNQIRGNGMLTLVKSLPGVTGGKFIVYNNDGTEGNRITTVQVEAANTKGWSVLTSGGFTYLGVDPRIAIDATNFPDKNFRKWLREKTDYGADGYLSDEEIAVVTTITVSNHNISDLTGIEYFTALTELDCSYNRLTSLNVSNNTALTRLYCYCNQIWGAAMTELVNSLPETEEGTLWGYYIGDSPAGNMMTIKQVKIATDKNWSVVMWDDDYEKFMPYYGEIGDANGDDEVTAKDIECLRDHILGLNPESFSLESADLDESRTVDIVDLTKLIKKLKE